MSSDLIRHYRQLVGIAAGWAKKTLPGWADEMHRDLLTRHGAVEIEGRISASSLSLPQLDAVLDDYERRGWQRQRGQHRGGDGQPRQVPAQIAHITRLWAKLSEAGALRNGSRVALLAFCSRQVGGREVPNLDSLSASEAQGVIEALKSWLARGGL